METHLLQRKLHVMFQRRNRQNFPIFFIDFLIKEKNTTTILNSQRTKTIVNVILREILQDIRPGYKRITPYAPHTTESKNQQVAIVRNTVVETQLMSRRTGPRQELVQ